MLYVVWRTWCYYWNYFPSHHFFSKWLPYRENVSFVRFRWKMISWGNLTLRTWWYYQNFVTSHHLFFKMAASYHKISTLSDFNENLYLGVNWWGEHDGTIEKNFWSCNFFSKWPPYCVNCMVADFNNKLFLGVFWCVFQVVCMSACHVNIITAI